MNHNDYLDANFRVFPLWPIANGECTCEDPECKQPGKHPRISGWQNCPHWSDEQLDTMEAMGQFATGFGVNVDGLIIDIDPRNGGDKSYKQLKEDTGLDYEQLAGLVVRTGGGGLHIYFAMGEPMPMVQHLKSYPGIDFKSSGFVVGAGSLHASGQLYEAEGHPDNLTQAPERLTSLLKKPDSYRASTGTSHIDVTDQEIADLLAHVEPDCDYETWINIGMAIHDATHGAGFELWDTWSSNGSKYDSAHMDKHWQSFGKCSNPVTIGTLIHHAEEGGYKRPVTFSDLPEEMQEPISGLDDLDDIDLLRPPGLVGEVCDWINSQCLFPRERLAMATAINIIGNLGGLRHEDELNNITANTFMLCIAGSSTGKETVQQAGAQLMRTVDMAECVHGKIKSDLEITKNLIRHQFACYIVDEFGIELRKINNATKRGGAVYLEGVIGALMSIFTKANGYYLIGGDLKEEMRASVLRDIAMLEKKESENELGDAGRRRLQSLTERVLPGVANGLERPFLSLMGYSTPETFVESVSGENAKNGFIGRCILIDEKETNPWPKEDFERAPDLPINLKSQLRLLAWGGISSDEQGRIEYYGDRVKVPTDKDAKALLKEVSTYFMEYAEQEKARSGLEAIPRRGYEMVAKVSHILSIPSKLRTVEHVRWAFKLVKQDVAYKINLAQRNELEESLDANDQAFVLRSKIVDICKGEAGESISVIKKRCGRKYNASDVEQMVEEMLGKHLEKIEKKTKGRPSVRYRAL